MEQQNSSTSKVTVEYHDPHDVYKLLAPGLIPRLPLHDLHWKSHSGPLRSIGTLHVDLVRGGEGQPSATSTPALRRSDSTAREDGFQTQNVGGRATSSETVESSSQPPGSIAGSRRRHQIPGLRRTPYLKVLLVRCDDNDSYKNTVRSEVREWIKANTSPSGGSKKSSNQERHDTCEWLIVHVVIPNTVAATQPRSSSSKSDSGATESKSSSRWRGGSTPLLEKFRSDFNSSGKGAVDRVAQIRIGINDVPYDLLPRVVPAVPSGYSETEQDAENAWRELINKFKDLILSSFDQRVSQYEDDIKEKDSQRTLPGWNFCTFFILKEGLAQGFENVGLVEDALVGYDELSIGLDSIVKGKAEADSLEHHGAVLLSYTEDLKTNLADLLSGIQEGADDEEAVNLQSKDTGKDQFDEIPISSTKKAYRDMILANNVSVFDFRCYIFSRQIALLLRLGNAQSTREELLAKLKEQQESVLHGVAPRAPPPQKKTEESENLGRLAEICRRTLEFIPSVSYILRQDITAALEAGVEPGLEAHPDMSQDEAVDNLIASFAFSVAQQILAQTSTKAVPIPPSTLREAEQKASIPEPKTIMHPARSSSLHVRPTQRPPPSPGVFPGPGQRASLSGADVREAQQAKSGLEELAAKRADLYLLSRSILTSLGKRRGWSNGWAEAPLIGEADVAEMEDISLEDNGTTAVGNEDITAKTASSPSPVGINSKLLRTAVDNQDDFYRLYEILTDKAFRHFTVAGQDYSAFANMSDLAVLKYHLKEFRDATTFFCQTTPFFGDSGWSWLEISMLIMYSKCLKAIQSKEYVRVALKLLTKAAEAEEEWLRRKATVSLGGKRSPAPDMAAINDAVGAISDLATSIPSEARMPLSNFATDIELAGPPKYHENCDSCEVDIVLRSLLPGELRVSSVALRAACVDGGPCKQIWFKMNGDHVLSRGKNILTVKCTSIVPGSYKVDHLGIVAGNLSLYFDRDAQQAPTATEYIFRAPNIRLSQRAGALDADLTAWNHTALDKNNSLELRLSTGWNQLSSCEVRVKPATGGLRLLTTDATIVGSDDSFAKRPEAGMFFFGPVGAGRTLTVHFPYTTEQDIGVVTARLEITYKTEADDTFTFAKSSMIPIALALNVNVQDVFKHEALFSRFSVSTATGRPLRLIKSELSETDLFVPSSGMPWSDSVIVFAKQPATLLYKIKRKNTDGASGKATDKAMQLKLYYSLLDTEVRDTLRMSIGKSLEQTDLAPYKRPIEAIVDEHVHSGWDTHALERAALLGEVTTGILEGIRWDHLMRGLGAVPGTGQDVGLAVSAFFSDWLKSYPRISLLPPGRSELSSILIPVEIPSVAVVHTTDIQLRRPSSPAFVDEPTPTVTIGQVLSATLQLRWTRIWDTKKARRDDKEFSYEIAAPPEAWLLGGRRRGHFVIPGDSTPSSTPGTEAAIPLTLIPQREGWLPYPSVEIKEISADGEVVEQQAQSFEIDLRNLGETIRVVGGRKGVTVSLDAGSPGGGPLVLEGERLRKNGERVVA